MKYDQELIQRTMSLELQLGDLACKREGRYDDKYIQHVERLYTYILEGTEGESASAKTQLGMYRRYMEWKVEETETFTPFSSSSIGD